MADDQEKESDSPDIKVLAVASHVSHSTKLDKPWSFRSSHLWFWGKSDACS